MKKNNKSAFEPSPYKKSKILKNIKHFFTELKYACQRFKRGYSDRDVLSIDAWFLKIMPKILNDFSQEIVSAPKGYTVDEWKKIISQMREAFLKSAPKEDFTEDEIKELIQQMDVTFVNNEKAKEQFAEQEERKAAKTEALTMFTEYFDQLWS